MVAARLCYPGDREILRGWYSTCVKCSRPLEDIYQAQYMEELKELREVRHDRHRCSDQCDTLDEQG